MFELYIRKVFSDCPMKVASLVYLSIGLFSAFDFVPTSYFSTIKLGEDQRNLFITFNGKTFVPFYHELVVTCRLIYALRTGPYANYLYSHFARKRVRLGSKIKVKFGDSLLSALTH